MWRGHQRLEHRQVRHELRRTRQRFFTLLLEITKCLNRIGEIETQVTPHLILDAALNDKQRHRRKTGGGQEHRNQKFGT